MESTSWLLLVVICVVILAILLSERVSKFTIASVVLFLIYAGYTTFVRTTECLPTGGPCHVELQNTLLGPCWSSNQAGILTIGNKYFLTAAPGARAYARCIKISGLWER
jgi:hypothetical protein